MDSLKSQRKGIKAAITRIHNYCTGAHATDSEISVRIVKLDEYFRNFERIQDEIDAKCETPEDLIEEENYRIELEARYYAIKATCIDRGHAVATIDIPRSGASQQQLVNAVESIARNQSTLGDLVARLSTEATTSTPTPSTQNSYDNRETIKLPRIQLPEFDGTYTNWIRFRDLFEVTIHNNQRLGKIEKFEYLQCHLRGDALSIIKHLSPSNDNYDVGWKLIKDKFDNFDLIKRSYLKLLIDQPSMKGAFINDLKRLINNTNESVNALKTLNEQVDQWGSIMLFQLERKLDSESQTLWYRCATNSPTFTKFMEFLSQRLTELETQAENKAVHKLPLVRSRNTSHIHASMVKMCPVCNERHPLYLCDKFKAFTVVERLNIVRSNNLCYNCMQDDHVAAECTRSKCKKCNNKHNTLLHREASRSSSSQGVSTETKNVSIHTTHSVQEQDVAMLPTAIAMIRDHDKNYQSCRILLDTGAQVSLISEACAQRLGLKRKFDNTVLCGIGESKGNRAHGRVDILLRSAISDGTLSTTALCLPKLTQFQPAHTVARKKLKYFDNLMLADNKCNIPSTIDLILGADTFSDWFLDHKIVHPSGSPVALSTIFGWAIIGKVPSENRSHVTIAHTSIDTCDQLRKFWELEEVTDGTQRLTEDEEKAELYYQQTVEKTESGRYMVRLPFRSEKTEVGNTKQQALKRLGNMERKFNNNAALRREYCNFMKEYIMLDHMTAMQNPDDAHYMLPHHAVFKTSSTTTKLRVVFDGSAKGINGMSLNDQLLVGPTFQNDIFTILVQFRKGKIGLCGDIEKMYRQILVHPDDRPYQAIFWRENSQQPISTFCLNTVTYGTSSAPFLAVRTLRQVALDHQHENASIAEVIQQCFYVDDLIHSAPDIATAINTRTKLSSILMESGLHLRKWSSNSTEVMSLIDVKDRETTNETIFDDDQSVKTLGLYWDVTGDNFRYRLAIPKVEPTVTKRSVLSIISRIFDPLGWASPVVITMKTFMQTLWLRGLGWDSELPEDLRKQWIQFHRNIDAIHTLRIPRWLQCGNHTRVELHGFADASEMAYAAVVYMKVLHQNGKITTSLIAAKTKVAPVKQVTLPRLELCAAQLAVKLLVKVKRSLRIDPVEMFGWTDSTIVLAWLSDHPRRWKNFVANRTSYILEQLPSHSWRHIESKQNPADVATRGSTSVELATNKLWWNGPSVLHCDHYNSPLRDKIETTEHEERKKGVFHVTTTDDVVILIDDQLPPTRWSIGRIADTHPGLDGLVRVVTVKTKTGHYKRPTSKICPLLVDN